MGIFTDENHFCADNCKFSFYFRNIDSFYNFIILVSFIGYSLIENSTISRKFIVERKLSNSLAIFMSGNKFAKMTALGWKGDRIQKISWIEYCNFVGILVPKPTSVMFGSWSEVGDLTTHTPKLIYECTIAHNLHLQNMKGTLVYVFRSIVSVISDIP